MSEILSYFFHPELSMDVLLNNEGKKKWLDGILKWILVAILSGLMTIVIYQIVGMDLESLSTTYYGDMVERLSQEKVNEGFIWLALAGLSIGELLVSAFIRTCLWVILLYVGSKVVRDRLSIHQIIKMSVFAILTWIVSQLFLNIVICISMVSPIQTINEMLISLGMLLSYWGVILFIIGYSILAKSTFFKGGIIVLIIQGILWGIANAFPFLKMFLV